MVDTHEPHDLADLAALLRIDLEALKAILPDPVRRIRFYDNWSDDYTQDESDDGLQRFACGDPELVVIDISPEKTTVAEATITWLSHTPLVEPGAVHLDVPIAVDADELEAAVNSAASARRSTLLVCSECEWTGPPERMWASNPAICHGCAQRNHGVLF